MKKHRKVLTGNLILSIQTVCKIFTKLITFKRKYLTIEFENDSVFINGVEIINNRGKNRFRIFMILFDQYIVDKKRTRNTDAFKFLNVNEIALIFNKSGFPINDIEKQVRLPIYEIMKKVPNLIEFKKWSGCHDKNFGYRFNAKYVRIGV